MSAEWSLGPHEAEDPRAAEACAFPVVFVAEEDFFPPQAQSTVFISIPCKASETRKHILECLCWTFC